MRFKNGLYYKSNPQGKIRGTYFGRPKKSKSAKELLLQGHERCAMKHILSDKIGDEVLMNVASFLADPAKFAKDWFKDVDFEALKKNRVERLKPKSKKRFNDRARHKPMG